MVNTATTIVTFLMVFLIQNTQNRDGAAIQAKLDAVKLYEAKENQKDTQRKEQRRCVRHHMARVCDQSERA